MPGTDGARPLRVLFVGSGILGHRTVERLLRDSAAAEGIDASFEEVGEALTPAERAVRRLVCWRPGGEATALSGLTLERWRHEMHAGLLAAKRIREREREEGAFDVLHFHTQATAWGSLGRMRRTPSVVSIDWTQSLAAEEAPGALARLGYVPAARRDRAVFRAARAVVATSRLVQQRVVEEDPDLWGRVIVMPYPVPREPFDPAWAEARRARLRRRGAKVRVLFVGGDFRRKGGEELLAVWESSGLSDGAELRLVTSWPLVESRLPPGVRVVPGVSAYTPEWAREWADADLFAMPTRAEAFGMVFQEAAAAGLPAIGTRVGAIPEIVVDGETGILVPPGDVGALAKALTAMVDDAGVRERMGAAARERILTRGDPAAYASRLANLLRWAVTSGPVEARR